MRSLLKTLMTYNVKDLFRTLAENEKDNLNREIIGLQKRLEEAYKRRDYINEKLGYA